MRTTVQQMNCTTVLQADNTLDYIIVLHLLIKAQLVQYIYAHTRLHCDRFVWLHKGNTEACVLGWEALTHCTQTLAKRKVLTPSIVWMELTHTQLYTNTRTMVWYGTNTRTIVRCSVKLKWNPQPS